MYFFYWNLNHAAYGVLKKKKNLKGIKTERDALHGQQMF